MKMRNLDDEEKLKAKIINNEKLMKKLFYENFSIDSEYAGLFDIGEYHCVNIGKFVFKIGKCELAKIWNIDDEEILKKVAIPNLQTTQSIIKSVGFDELINIKDLYAIQAKNSSVTFSQIDNYCSFIQHLLSTEYKVENNKLNVDYIFARKCLNKMLNLCHETKKERYLYRKMCNVRRKQLIENSKKEFEK